MNGQSWLEINNLEVVFTEGRVISEGDKEENSLTIFIGIQDVRGGDKVKVILKERISSEVLSLETIKFSQVDDHIFYNYSGRTKKINDLNKTLGVVMYINNLKQEDVVVEVYGVDSLGNNTNKLTK